MRSRFVIIAALAAVLSVQLAACGEVEYPEGADTLPTVTTTTAPVVLYDTAASTVPEPETSVVTYSTSVVQITLPEETTSTEAAPTETETAASATVSLDLSDIPEVGISEYYNRTETTVKQYAETEFSPKVIESDGTSAVHSTVQTSAASVTSGTSASTTAVSRDLGDDSGTVTSASAETTASYSLSWQEVKLDNASFSVGGSDLLKDGRISPYTGKQVISHPYSYYTLTAGEQALYDRLAGAMLNYEESVTFEDAEGITFDNIHSMYQLIYNDEYRLYYISPTIQYSQYASGNIMVMKFDYSFSADNVRTMNTKLEAAMDDILSELSSDMNDYEIVKTIHDSIIKSCVYSSANERMNTVYGCLVDKLALCQGYARSFTYLCSEAGIDTFVVLGVAKEAHMWNAVKMDNDWYHIDLTWDDPDRSANPDSVRYDYFGLTDARIRELRTVDDYDYEVPQANGTRYQYYSYNGLVADSFDSAVSIIKSEALKASHTKSSTIQFQCSDSAAYNEITQRLFADSAENIVAVLDSVKTSAENKYKTDTIVHNNNSSTYTVKIYLDYGE